MLTCVRPTDEFAKFWFSFTVECGSTLGLRSSLGTQRIVELHSAVQLVLTNVLVEPFCICRLLLLRKFKAILPEYCAMDMTNSCCTVANRESTCNSRQRASTRHRKKQFASWCQQLHQPLWVRNTLQYRCFLVILAHFKFLCTLVHIVLSCIVCSLCFDFLCGFRCVCSALKPALSYMYSFIQWFLSQTLFV